MVYGLQYLLGVFGAFSELHRKMSVHWVCSMVKLSQTSENVFSSDLSASSALVYYVCGSCPSGTSENVLRLMHQVIYCTDIGECLIMCNQVYFALQFMKIQYQTLRHREMSEMWLRLLLRPKPMCFVLHMLMRSIHRFLSAVQLRCQHLPFSILDGSKTI